MGCQQCKRSRVGTIVEDKANEIDLPDRPITTSPPIILDRAETSQSQPSVKQDQSKNKPPVAPANVQKPAEISLVRENYPESFSESISSSSHSSSWTDCSDETAEPVVPRQSSSSRAQSSRFNVVASTVPHILYTETISSVSSDSEVPDFRPNRSSTPNSEPASSSINTRFIFSPRRPSVLDYLSERARSQGSLMPHRKVPLHQTAISPMPNSPQPGVINTSKILMHSLSNLPLQRPEELPVWSSQPSMAERRMTVTPRAMHEIVVRGVQSATSKLSTSELPRKSPPSESSSQSDEI